jgi:hypothetical protein
MHNFVHLPFPSACRASGLESCTRGYANAAGENAQFQNILAGSAIPRLDAGRFARCNAAQEPSERQMSNATGIGIGRWGAGLTSYATVRQLGALGGSRA